MARNRRSLSLRSVLLLALASLCVIAFFEIVEEVLEGEATSFDAAVLMWMHALDSPFMDLAMRVVTFFGSTPAVLMLVTIVASWALRRRERNLAAVLVTVASVAEGLNFLLKAVFQRERPELFFEIIRPESFSLPSGHAMASAATYGMAAIVASRLEPRLRTLLAIATPLFVALIGASRVFLGVHWPTDVLAGFLGGLFVVVAGVALVASTPKSVMPMPTSATASPVSP